MTDDRTPMAGLGVSGATIPAHPFAAGITLLAAGPEDGVMDRWAGLLGPALAPGARLRRVATGGVTGANRLDT